MVNIVYLRMKTFTLLPVYHVASSIDKISVDTEESLLNYNSWNKRLRKKKWRIRDSLKSV